MYDSNPRAESVRLRKFEQFDVAKVLTLIDTTGADDNFMGNIATTTTTTHQTSAKRKLSCRHLRNFFLDAYSNTGGNRRHYAVFWPVSLLRETGAVRAEENALFNDIEISTADA